MRLKDIRIGAKILVLVVIGIIGMAILSISGYNAMSKAGDDLDNMYHRKLKATRLLGNEINYTRKVQLGVTKHIIDPKDEQIVTYVKEALDSYEKTWPQYRELAIRADNVAPHIPEVEKQWAEYRKGLLEVKQLTDAGKKQEAWDLYKKMENGITKDLVASEMQAVSAATEEQSASAEEIAAASEALATLAQGQQEALSHFRF